MHKPSIIKLGINKPGESFWLIFHTKELRQKVFDKLLAKYPQLNYAIYWKDVQGYGMQLSVCSWVAPRRFYFVP